MTVREALQGINAYPIPERTLGTIMLRRGLSASTEATKTILESGEFRLAHADVLKWLSRAPNVSQGGQNYSFSDKQRKDLADEANATYGDLEPESVIAGRYGYKGEWL